jgi:hypothetical protein
MNRSQPMLIGDSSTLASARGRRPATSSTMVQLLLPRIVWWMNERPLIVCVLGFQSYQYSLESGHAVLPPTNAAHAFQYSSFL